MILRLAVALALLTLAGCTTAPPSEPRIVTVAVSSPCVPADFGPAPSYPDTDEALRQAPDAAERYRLMGQGRAARIGRLGELETVVAGCPKAGQ